ncbi:unnamed protein product [Plasmodium vivax]|uniref:(malaria parasite P. vivax) hypothetical protein n=1 Tax=Plasmodium vivax TaxID=5855 RepID=A0A8S4HCC3_PLAVI|nr:unnamed protein product [Plasmodium vivax]
MVGVAKWSAPLLGVLLMKALPRPQCSPPGRNLSELSLYLGSHHSGGHHHSDNEIREPDYHYQREKNYNPASAYERRDASEDRLYRRAGNELAPVPKNHLGNRCKVSHAHRLDVYGHANKVKLPDENDLSTYQENQHMLRKFSSDGRLPFGCTHWDLSQILTNKQILKKVTYIAFDISLRKAFIGYYYFLIFLNRCYYSMVNKMSTWFMNVANSRNIPDHVRVAYWAECRRNLIRDLEVLEEMSKNYFDTFIRGNSRVWIVNYEMCLERCRKLWKKAIVNNRVKWSRTLSMWIVKYDQGGRGGGSGGGGHDKHKHKHKHGHHRHENHHHSHVHHSHDHHSHGRDNDGHENHHHSHDHHSHDHHSHGRDNDGHENHHHSHDHHSHGHDHHTHSHDHHTHSHDNHVHHTHSGNQQDNRQDNRQNNDDHSDDLIIWWVPKDDSAEWVNTLIVRVPKNNNNKNYQTEEPPRYCAITACVKCPLGVYAPRVGPNRGTIRRLIVLRGSKEVEGEPPNGDVEEDQPK